MKKTISEIFYYLKANGIKATLKKYKWRFVAMVFIYYLIRDTLLYILLPALIMSSAYGFSFH